MQVHATDIQQTSVEATEEKKGKKFLLIRLSSIGEIVLATPVIRCLKNQVADAEVHFLTEKEFKPVIEHNPYIDKLHLLEGRIEQLAEKLWDEHFDYIIDLQHNERTSQLKKELKAPSVSYNKLAFLKSVYTSVKLNFLPRVHLVDRYMKTVERFGVVNDGAGPDYFISKEEEIKRGDIPAAHAAGYIVCAIGGAYSTRRWPVHKWKEFCEKMDHPIVLLGGPEDRQRGDTIALADSIKVYNACGKFSLNECADIIRHAKLVISHDSGLMPIATAYKKPVISLWGNTVPSFGMYPYYGNWFADVQLFDMVQVNKLRCRPCSQAGYGKCPQGHFKCMEKITVDAMLGKTRQRI